MLFPNISTPGCVRKQYVSPALSLKIAWQCIEATDKCVQSAMPNTGRSAASLRISISCFPPQLLNSQHHKWLRFRVEKIWKAGTRLFPIADIPSPTWRQTARLHYQIVRIGDRGVTSPQDRSEVGSMPRPQILWFQGYEPRLCPSREITGRNDGESAESKINAIARRSRWLGQDQVSPAPRSRYETPHPHRPGDAG